MKRILKNCSGNIAVTTAVMLATLGVTAGVAIDYISVQKNKSAMQNSLDAAILNVGKTYRDMTEEEIKNEITQFLEANLSDIQLSQLQDLEIVLTPDKSRLSVLTKAKHPATLTRIAGFQEFDYLNEASINSSKQQALELVLVLDTTGSMGNSNKMTDLKTVSNNLINDLFPDGSTDPLKLAIVPFATYANVGVQYHNADWLNTEPLGTVPSTPTNLEDTSPVYPNYPVAFDPDTVVNVPSGSGYFVGQPATTTLGDEWRGCVGSREGGLNVGDSGYTGSKVEVVLNTNHCPSPIQPLTDNRQTLLDAVAALVPNGATYIPAGLVWGHRVVSENAPFTGGVPYSDVDEGKAKKVIVLMTDGKNTRSKTPNHHVHEVNTNNSEADSVTLQACDAIKDDKISLYTISFGTSVPVPTIDMLRACATSFDNYYSAEGAQQLSNVFEAIVKENSKFFLSN